MNGNNPRFRNSLKIKFFRFNWILSIVLILTGCFRPNYVQQRVNVPTNWRFEADEGSTLCNFRWWEQFDDPVLNEFILTALKNNQDIRLAIARVYEFYARLGIANSALYPSLFGEADFTRTQVSLLSPSTLPTGSSTTGTGTGTGTTPAAAVPIDMFSSSSGSDSSSSLSGLKRIVKDYRLFLNLAWQLDFWGQLASASEAAYADLASEIEARRAVVLTVTTSVANAYITLRQLDAQLEIAKQTLQSRIQSLHLAQIRFELGETSELEVKQAESEIEDALISKIEFERDIPQQEDLLSILMGENPRSIERGSAISAFEYPISIPAGIPSDILRRRPDVVQAEERLIAANARTTEAFALFFPQINLTGLYGNESTQLRDLLTSPAVFWQYGANALQPIFTGGRIYYQYEAAKAIRNESLAIYRQSVLVAFQEVNDALIGYRKNVELFHEHQRQVKVLGQYLHLAQLRYQEGEIDYLNVLDAERALFNAQLSMVQAQADSFIAVVQIYGALGGGWVIDADNIATSVDKCSTKDCQQACDP